MSIDEAIKHSEEVAEEKKKEAWEAQLQEEYKKIKSCNKCAAEHRQLAEWLKELKAHREAWEKLRTEIQDETELAYADFGQYKVDVLEVDVDDLPHDDYRYGMERTLELISKYRPKEGDVE